MMTMLLLTLIALFGLGLATYALWQQGQHASDERRRTAARPYVARRRRGVLLAVLVGLAGMILLAQGVGLVRELMAAPDVLVVRIAPFETTALDQRQGTIVARQLSDELTVRTTTPLDLGTLNAPISSTEQALAVARERDIDVLIWGSVAQGATAYQAGLQPHLVWIPDQAFAPRRMWYGYDGYFALPRTYDLALQPLNGPAVLAPLLDGINHWTRGDADLAAAQFQALSRDYSDVLRPELPAMAKASIFWAQGFWSDAETEARAALAAADRPEHRNNLGVVLLAQGQNEAAEETLRQALAATLLAEAQANLGRLLLAQGRSSEAIELFRGAVQARPLSSSFLVALAEAERRSGLLEQARQTTEALLGHDQSSMAAVAEQALLALTDVPTATVRLEWELERPPSRSLEELETIRARFEEGMARLEQRRADYLREANAYGASGRPGMQRLAEQQVDQVLQELLLRRSQLVLVQVEQGRVAAMQPRSPALRLWDVLRGRRTPLEQAIATVEELQQYELTPAASYDLLYQAGRAAYFGQRYDFARQQWDAAERAVAEIEPVEGRRGWPETHYGRARILLDEGDSQAAQAELNTALAADERFFPARELLASLAEQERRWDEAQTQYSWLVEHRPWDPLGSLGLARVLIARNDLAGAEALLLSLANAGNADALVALASLYRSVGVLDQAQVVLDRALDTDPRSIAVHEEMAAQALARGDPEAAETALQQALEIDPHRSSSHLALGQLYLQHLNRPQAAVEHFRAAVNIDGEDGATLRLLGEALLQSDQASVAADAFRRAAELQPASPEAYHGLAAAYLALERYDLAAEQAARALELSNDAYAPAWVALGDVAWRQGNAEEAIRHYNAALERDAHVAGAYLGLGQIALAQGRPEAAIEQYRRGLETAPNNLPLLLALGDGLLRLNDVQEAMDVYRQAERLAPQNGRVYAGLGRALWKADRSDTALAALDRAVQLGADDADTMLLIGEINMALGRSDAALAAFGKAAAARPEWHEPRFQRGVVLLQLEQNAQAIEELEAAVQLGPNAPQAFYWLGRAYRAAGRPEAAAIQFRSALDLQPEYHEARYFLGRTLEELGQTADAVAAYQRIVDVAPPADRWRDEAQRELRRVR